MTDNVLKAIRQNIACPQFGDDHYGSWGALNLNQRRAIKRMLDHINILEAEIERLRCDLEQTEDAFNKTYEMLAAYRAKFDDIVVGNESIVRCKDCKYSKTTTDPIAGHTIIVCDLCITPRQVIDTHYCGYGDRKDDFNADD